MRICPTAAPEARRGVSTKPARSWKSGASAPRKALVITRALAPEGWAETALLRVASVKAIFPQRQILGRRALRCDNVSMRERSMLRVLVRMDAECGDQLLARDRPIRASHTQEDSLFNIPLFRLKPMSRHETIWSSAGSLVSRSEWTRRSRLRWKRYPMLPGPFQETNTMMVATGIVP
jgi:hypothetical protein